MVNLPPIAIPYKIPVGGITLLLFPWRVAFLVTILLYHRFALRASSFPKAVEEFFSRAPVVRGLMVKGTPDTIRPEKTRLLYPPDVFNFVYSLWLI